MRCCRLDFFRTVDRNRKESHVIDRDGLVYLQKIIKFTKINTIISIANALSVTGDDLLCDNIIMAKVQFEKDIALLLEDCDEYEIRIIKDMIGSLKDTLRRDANLRTADRKIH